MTSCRRSWAGHDSPRDGRARRRARRPAGVGERLPRHPAPARGLGPRGRRHHHRPGGRPGPVPRPARPRVRLGAWTTGTGSAGDGRRPPARMRRPGHGRLLRRPGPEAGPRPGAARLPAGGGRRGRRGRHHQGPGLGRRGDAARPARSSCSTRSTTRPRTSRPT